MSENRMALSGLRSTAAYVRAQQGWNELLELWPTAYCAYRRRRQPTWPVVSAGADIVIEGRPGCGNSFAREATLLTNPGIRVASHVHSPAQALEGVRLGKPVVVIVRSPADAVASEAARFDGVDVRRELRLFARFYERLLPSTRDMVVVTFEAVTQRFGEVMDHVNSRFGTSFVPFPHDDRASVERVFATLLAYDASQGVDGGRSAIPGQAREERAERARAMLGDPELDPLMRRCETAHARFAAQAAV
jgi:hypothetical protein